MLTDESLQQFVNGDIRINRVSLPTGPYWGSISRINMEFDPNDVNGAYLTVHTSRQIHWGTVADKWQGDNQTNKRFPLSKFRCAVVHGVLIMFSEERDECVIIRPHSVEMHAQFPKTR